MKQLFKFIVLSWPLLYSAAVAQQSSVTGTVMHTQTSEMLAGVHVFLTNGTQSGIIAGDYTDAEGRYDLKNVPPGTYDISISYIGCKPVTRSITVDRDLPMNLDFTLNETVITLNELVVTASRRDEKLVDAPAATTVISSRDIQRNNTLSPVEHIRGVQGVDVQQKGIMANEYAARGLNNVFNGNVRTLTDNRMTNLPALRANIGYLQHVTNSDIDRIEMVLGPGSALYGPNVTNGVMHTITKSPFASRGTDVTVMGGNQGLFGVSGRNAGLITDKLGYKISAQYTSAEDWEHTDNLEPYPSEIKAERYTVDARADYITGENSVISLSGGHSEALQALDLTDNGAVIAKNFSFDYVQGKFTSGNLFAQAYINMNDAGDTYFLASGDAIVDHSKKMVAEIQHSAELTDWQRLIYGADMYLTRPETEGTIMGRNEDKDNVNEFGGYLQSETKLPGGFATLLLAGRMDKHSALEEAVFSPRAGVNLSPARGHNVRLMYNRAFMTPVISELFLDLPITGDVFDIEARFGTPVEPLMYGLRNTGVPSTGYHFDRSNGELSFHSAFAPEMGALPVSQAAVFWDGIVALITAQNPELAPILSQIPAPQAGEVGGSMNMLNIEKARSGTEANPFDPISMDDVKDIARLRPTIQKNYELGYTGSVSEDVQIGSSVYYSEYQDFITPGRVITPNVFLNGEDAYSYLYGYISQMLPPEEAAVLSAQVAEGMAQIPLGTVSPEEAQYRTELIMAPVNYGAIQYWGADVSLLFNLSSSFALGTNYSYINKNYFDDVEGMGPLSLNVPKHKAAVSLFYTNTSTAIRGSVRYRFNDGFKVRSGIYEGQITPYGLVDVALSVPIPVPMRPTLNLNVNNLLDYRHREYIGGGNIGRLITAGLSISI